MVQKLLSRPRVFDPGFNTVSLVALYIAYSLLIFSFFTIHFSWRIPLLAIVLANILSLIELLPHNRRLRNTQSNFTNGLLIISLPLLGLCMLIAQSANAQSLKSRADWISSRREECWMRLSGASYWTSRGRHNEIARMKPAQQGEWLISHARSMFHSFYEEYFLFARKKARLIKKVENKLNEVNQTMRSSSDPAARKRYQKKRGELREQLTHLRRVSGSSDMLGLSVNKRDELFDNILSTPEVMRVDVVPDGLTILIRARFAYSGKVYDLGDWNMIVSQKYNVLFAVRQRGGLALTPAMEPPYININDTFCFGGNTRTIVSHMESGRFYEAIQLAIRCMCDVNPEYHERIPYVYDTVPSKFSEACDVYYYHPSDIY